MKVLITGAFGNLGKKVLELLTEKNYEISCFVTATHKSKRIAKKFPKRYTIIYGDVRKIADVAKAVKNMDIIIHLAAIVPPRFKYENPEYAQQVNVDGTKNILLAMKQQEKVPKLIYASTVAVFGDVRKKGACILKADEPVNPNTNDIYAQQKVQSEIQIKESNVPYAILRFGFMPNIDRLKFDDMMFDVPLDTNMEVIHIKDAARAIVNALEKPEIWGKIFHVAGGETCRITYKEFITSMLETMGIGMLPGNAFGDDDFHCAFFDTNDSQQLLHYQNYSFQQILTELQHKTKALRFVTTLFRPVARRFLLGKSKYYKSKMKE